MPASDSTAGESAGSARVLVVDDDAGIRQLLRVCLETDGYEVVEAPSGRKALERVESGDIDVILLDENMPGLQGREVVRRLRAKRETETLPVILVTADGDVPSRVAGLESGATDYVTKPFDLDELRARVRAHVRSRDAWHQLVADLLSERTAVVEAMRRAANQTTAEGIAQVLCEEISVMEAVAGVALVTFGALGAALPMGAAGAPVWGMVVGRPAPSPVARYFTFRAAVGPWVERGDPDLMAEPSVGSLLTSDVVACAPLNYAGRVIGLLLVGSGQRAPASQSASTLSSAIDFAQLAATMIGPHLVTRQREETDRLDIFSVIARGAFSPYFQPIVDLASGVVVGFEALTRFHDDTPPESRFTEATAVGLGPDLEAATITASLRAAGDLPARRWVSINVSPALLADSERVADLLTAGPEIDIVLELSEHDRVDDYDALRTALAHPRINARLSVDDAGSGFASLRHILILEPAFMKLDRSWVQGIEAAPARQALVAGLHGFCVASGCRLIAEGIETARERATLRALGVELGQGFLFGHAAPARVWQEAVGRAAVSAIRESTISESGLTISVDPE